MKLQILFIAVFMMFGLQTTWATSPSIAMNGIEPIVAEDFNGEDPPKEETVEEKIIKKEKSGFAKMFS